MILPPPLRPIILASASPRRRELLQQLGLKFKVIPASIDEDLNGTDPETTALTLAKRKGTTIAQRFPDHLVIAADTIVLHQGTMLGKPRDEAEARTMLQALSGDWHQVITGLVLQVWDAQLTFSAVEVTRVHFLPLSSEEISAYLAEGTALDKAGAYAIQGSFGIFIDRIEGCYYDVVGLPLARFGELYKNVQRKLGDLRNSGVKPNVGLQ